MIDRSVVASWIVFAVMVVVFAAWRVDANTLPDTYSPPPVVPAAGYGDVVMAVD